MDPVLSSLFPVHQIGSDGFNWWVGQIESDKNEDPKNSGRYRVRIVGQHLKSKDTTPTEELPWAQVMMPVTTPFNDGTGAGASVNLKFDNWVVGFYLDNDRQKPIIMGSVGHTAGATKVENVENLPEEGESFKTFLDPARDPYRDSPAAEAEKTEPGPEPDSTYTDVGQAGLSPTAIPGRHPSKFYNLFGENSTTNPIGSKITVDIADAKCGSESDLKEGITKIVSEMLAANQQSGGQLGTYYVSKLNGGLYNYEEEGRYHANRVIRLVNSSLARSKGEIVKQIKDGTDKLVETALYVETDNKIATAPADGSTLTTDPETGVTSGSVDDVIAAEDAAVNQALADDSNTTTTFQIIGGGTIELTDEYDLDPEPVIEPESGEPIPPPPKAKKEKRLQGVQTFLDDSLANIGCSIEDITDRLADFLTNLFLDILMEAYQAAVCLIDTVVGGIISEIQSLIDELVQAILGPINEILEGPVAAIDAISGIIQSVFDTLGISCDGPSNNCQKTKTESTDCSGDKKNPDWLDDLINQIEDGPTDYTSYMCDDAKQYPSTETTEAIPIGGIFDAPGGISGTSLGPDGTPSDTTVNTISYTCSDVIVVEGDVATFEITRSGNTTYASSLQYKVFDDTARNGDDYIGSTSGTIGFAPNDTKRTVSFRTFADDFDEGIETFSFSLYELVVPNNITIKYPNGNKFTCKIVDKILADSDDAENIDQDITTIPTVTFPITSVNTSPVVPYIVPTISTVDEKYSVDTNKPVYYNGDLVTYTITTENVDDGTSLQWELSGDIDENDIIGDLVGTVTIANNTGTVQVQLANNPTNPVQQTFIRNVLDGDGNPTGEVEEVTETIDVPEEVETLQFDLLETPAFKTVSIIPVGVDYFVSPDRDIVTEGETVTFNVFTSNVDDGTELTYTLTGIQATDVNSFLLEGTFVIENNEAQIPIEIREDFIDESPEVMTFAISNTDATASVTLLDADIVTVDPEITAPSYSVSADKLTYKEGETIIYTIDTQNVSDGTVLNYFLFGTNINSSDIVGGSLTGTFTIVDNQAKVYVGIEEDGEIEGDETLTFSLAGLTVATDVIISGDIDPEVVIDTEPPLLPCLTPPTFGEPITDDSGAIISIPVVDTGCPYQKPPRIIITGNGYGASAIALLDDRGYVSEVRVTRVGSNYKRNRPAPGLRCVIDSYTLIKPGLGYTSAPTVLVNGESGIAEALVNSKGFVFSVRILDRTKEYYEIPKITIFGGGGSGAKVLPNIICRDPVQLENLGYAKIGTGKYIDCP